MSGLHHIRFVRDYSKSQKVGSNEHQPEHIARALCSGERPFAEYVNRAIRSSRDANTKPAKAPRKKRAPRAKTPPSE